MTQESFEQFRHLVFQDRALQKMLKETADIESFKALVVRLGVESGYGFTLEDVEEALRASRRVWLERWIQ
ncbi:MAG: Nif11-like leader peptide family natural product precursor [Pyrinomonadaceae bacterium]